MAQGDDFPLGVLHLLIVGGLHGKEFVRNHIFLAFLVDNGIIVHQIEQEHGGAEKDSRYLQVKVGYAVPHVENLDGNEQDHGGDQEGNGIVKGGFVALSHVSAQDEQEGEEEKKDAGRHLGQGALNQEIGL